MQYTDFYDLLSDPRARRQRTDMAHPKRQIAALPLRVRDGGEIEVLLVTSRGSGRWILPKGRHMSGKTAWEAAATEALEEAGVSGTIGNRPLGRFDYKKTSGGRTRRVTIYPLEVRRVHGRWDEQDQRDRRWFTLDEAAAAIDFPHLQKILLKLRAEAGEQEQIRRLVARVGEA